MKITNVRIFTFTGIEQENPGVFYDNKNVFRVSPTDIHLGYKKKKGHISVTHTPQADGTFQIKHNYLQIDTDAGITGYAGPISNPLPPYYIHHYLTPILVGQDPRDIEKLWDLMYRTSINGRKGENMQAISYVDIALWDILCKSLGLPLYRLLGGKVQSRIPAYANTAGYPQDLESVAATIRTLMDEGYTAVKWGICYGPAQGDAGLRETVEKVRVIRETAGADFKIMLDAWSSWDVPYTLRIAEALAQYDITWIEEPVMPDLVQSYAKLNALCPIPIAGGEHEYTRWGFKALMDIDACDVYQPDPAWSGGISEVLKINALASAYDTRIAIHNSIPSISIHMSCAQPSSVIPIAEYLLLVGDASQYFLKNLCKPQDGYFYPPEEPGVGLDFDEAKIQNRTEWQPDFN